jgi:hypothetical protein
MTCSSYIRHHYFFVCRIFIERTRHGMALTYDGTTGLLQDSSRIKHIGRVCAPTYYKVAKPDIYASMTQMTANDCRPCGDTVSQSFGWKPSFCVLITCIYAADSDSNSECTAALRLATIGMERQMNAHYAVLLAKYRQTHQKREVRSNEILDDVLPYVNCLNASS